MSGIKMKLDAKKPTEKAKPAAKPKPTVAEVFNDDDDSEPEEMPLEARIRMRNIGKDTPTSAGPNSYGKTNKGFVDRRAELEKKLKQQLDDAAAQAEGGKRKGSSDSGGASKKAKSGAKSSDEDSNSSSVGKSKISFAMKNNLAATVQDSEEESSS